MREWRFPAWDPVMLPLWDPIHLRWYGFMFLLAFMVGQWILKRLARVRLLPIDEDKVYDLVVWLVAGVILGGRIGYATFYAPEMWRDPLSLVKLWLGGLSFHGGLVGTWVAFLAFAHKHKVSAWRLADGCAMAVPPGIAFVRFANFINGELYGREIAGQGPPWAMRFPTDRRAVELLGIRWEGRMKELAIRKAMHGEWEGMPPELKSVRSWEEVKSGVPLRHPSQLYEMLGEGVLLGLVLFVLWRCTRTRPLGAGVYGGTFLLGYGCVRFVVEWYRQPDEQFARRPGEIGTVFKGLSMGQLLCAAMIVAGVLLIALRWRHRTEAQVTRAG